MNVRTRLINHTNLAKHSPLLHIFLSFPSTNPDSQEHSYHSFLLLQIWLHPPLVSLSQGCTKKA